MQAFISAKTAKSIIVEILKGIFGNIGSVRKSQYFRLHRSPLCSSVHFESFRAFGLVDPLTLSEYSSLSFAAPGDPSIHA